MVRLGVEIWVLDSGFEVRARCVQGPPEFPRSEKAPFPSLSKEGVADDVLKEHRQLVLRFGTNR